MQGIVEFIRTCLPLIKNREIEPLNSKRPGLNVHYTQFKKNK